MDFEQLKQECLTCRKCGLCETRTHVVFGTGPKTAEVMLIGEGPGKNEDEQGLPFVGRSGKLLDQYLTAVDLARDKNVFIANIVKCRPPENRDPLPEEWDACLPWLREQFRIIRPKIVVCLGRIAAMKLIREDFKITREHGQWFEKAGVRMTAIYHPSALLRDPSRRPETFDDLKAIQQEISRICQRTTPAKPGEL